MNDYLQYIITAGIILAGIAYAYGQIIDRRNNSKFDTINLFKDQIDALEGKLVLQDTEIKKLTDEVHALKTELGLKDQKLTELLTLLQGRDPGMQAMIVALNEYMALGKPVLQYVGSELQPAVKRLERYLDKQTF